MPQKDVWATTFAIYSGVADFPKTLSALEEAYKSGNAVKDGYVRMILPDEDFSENSAWESSIAEYNRY